LAYQSSSLYGVCCKIREKAAIALPAGYVFPRTDISPESKVFLAKAGLKIPVSRLLLI